MDVALVCKAGRVRLRGALMVIALAMVGAGCGGSAAAPGPPTLPTRAAPNSVAGFPCPAHPVSTVDMEACAGRALLNLDARFNVRAAALWSILDASGKRAFLKAQTAWLTYRTQACAVQSRAFLGGTAAPVTFGTCETEITRTRLEEVAATLRTYCQGAARTGRYKRCPTRVGPGPPLHSRVILLNRSIGEVHLGQPRSAVEKALGLGRPSRGWVSYFDGRLLVDYVYKVRQTTHVQALVTSWSGFHTRSGVHVGSSVQDVRRRLHLPCGGGSCTSGVPGRPATILFTRHGTVVRIEVLYLS